MLSEDDKEAIKVLMDMYCNKKVGEEFDINEKEYIGITIKLITKLQKEIDRQKEKRENQKVELAILNEKQKEMNKLKNTVNSYYGMFKKQEKVIREIQKENEEKDNKVRKIIKRLDNDYKRITETKINKGTFPNYLDDYTRCRLKAYKTKTKEIKEYIEKQYFEKLAKENGEINNEK